MTCIDDLRTVRPETLIKINSADFDFMKPLKELYSNTVVLHKDCVNIDYEQRKPCAVSMRSISDFNQLVVT